MTPMAGASTCPQSEKHMKQKEAKSAAFQRWKAKQIAAGTYKQKKEEYRIAYFTKKIDRLRNVESPEGAVDVSIKS